MQPMRECPRFDRCSVNNCPLNTGYPDLYVYPEDMYPKCNMEKNVRVRISSKYPGILKFGGLKQREYSGKLREDRMTPEEKDKRISVLKINHFVPAVNPNTPLPIQTHGQLVEQT